MEAFIIWAIRGAALLYFFTNIILLIEFINKAGFQPKNNTWMSTFLFLTFAGHWFAILVATDVIDEEIGK